MYICMHSAYEGCHLEGPRMDLFPDDIAIDHVLDLHCLHLDISLMRMRRVGDQFRVQKIEWLVQRGKGFHVTIG